MTVRSPAPPFLLEREPQLATLASLWGEARSGAGRVALVAGEAGVGKTSLVTRFAAELGEPSTLWGACDALFAPRPLAPLQDIALQVGGPLRQALESEASRTRAFTAFFELLCDTPRVVILEDLHWADEATLDLLRWLGRRIARTSALLIASFRDDELPAMHPLRGVIGDLVAAGVTRRIDLPALSSDAVRTLAHGIAVDPGALHATTGGNAFLVTEMLAAGGSGVPPNVRDAVLARAARLSRSARAVLDAAAVLGPRIDLNALREVTSSEADAAEECLAAGVFKDAGGALLFRHELARRVVLEAISPPRRATLHALALAAHRMRPASQRSAALLAHYAEGAGDAEAVLEFAPVAAREAAAAGAHRQACEQWARALRFAEGLPMAERAVLLEHFAAECATVARVEEGIEARNTAILLWHQLGQPEKEGENLCWVQALYTTLGRNADAEDAGRRSIELLERLPPGPELAMAYRFRAHLRMLSRDIEESVAWGERAVELAERLAPLETRIWALSTLGTALCFSDYERGCELLERSLRMAGDAGLDSQVALAWLQLGSASGEVLQFRRADEYLARGIAYALERQIDGSYRYMVAWRSLVDLYLGRWPEAGAAAQALLRRPDAVGLSRNMALLSLGRLRARRGDPGVAEALDEAREMASANTHLQRLAPVHAARAEAAILADDPVRARAEALMAWDLAVAKRHPWFVGELAWCRHAAGEVVDVPDFAAPAYAMQIRGDWRGAAAEWERRGCPYERARALADGDATARREALAIFDGLGARPAADRLRRLMRQSGESRIPRGPRPSTRANPFRLTARELEILGLLAARASNSNVAARLHISSRTVDHHVSSILAKLEATTRDEAVKRAADSGLLPPAPESR